MTWRTPADVETAAPSATRSDLIRGLTAALRQAMDCAWWLVRAYVTDVHLLPRGEALEAPPARWLEGLAGPSQAVRRQPATSRAPSADEYTN